MAVKQQQRCGGRLDLDRNFPEFLPALLPILLHMYLLTLRDNLKPRYAISPTTDLLCLVNMTIKVYGMWYSSASSRVLELLLEKQIEFELIEVDVIEGQQKQPEYVALQPFAQVPVLQDGDLTLFESRAIMRYICEEYPTPGTPNFYGSTLIDKARVNQWLEVEGQQTCPILRDIYYPFLVESLGGKKVDHEIVAQNIEKLAKVLDVYEAHLSKNKYLAGSFVSIADLSHLLTCYLVFNLFKQADHELLKTRKHVSAWWDDISTRPAWLTVVRNASPVFDTWKSSNGVQ